MSENNGLTVEQTKVLSKLETTIEKGLAYWRSIGEALLQIQEQELFKPHKSLNAYAWFRFQMNAQDVCRYTRAVTVVRNLRGKFKDDELPTIEAHCRVLADYTSEQQIELWDNCLDLESITAKQIAEIGGGLYPVTTVPKPDLPNNPKFVGTVVIQCSHTEADALASTIGESYDEVKPGFYSIDVGVTKPAEFFGIIAKLNFVAIEISLRHV